MSSGIPSLEAPRTNRPASLRRRRCHRTDPERPRLRADHVLVERLTYLFRPVRRGDIVVIDASALSQCAGGGTVVKRIVGLGGDTIAYAHGALVVNGRHVSEPYLPPARSPGRSVPQTIVPRNSYFVMGDNRASSCDSREFGPVPRRALEARVALIYSPRLSFQ
jgi:signal peptidase I